MALGQGTSTEDDLSSLPSIDDRGRCDHTHMDAMRFPSIASPSPQRAVKECPPQRARSRAFSAHYTLSASLRRLPRELAASL